MLTLDEMARIVRDARMFERGNWGRVTDEGEECL